MSAKLQEDSNELLEKNNGALNINYLNYVLIGVVEIIIDFNLLFSFLVIVMKVNILSCIY